MGEIGIFSGSRFLFWTLAPFLLLFAAYMLAFNRDWISIGLAALALLLFIKLAAPRRFYWAGRALCAAVFLLYLGFFLADRRTTTLEGLLVWGLPAGAYALFARRPGPPIASSPE